MNLKKFQVDDLSFSDSDVIFIMESPHTQELKAGYPAAGAAGVNMSRVLFNSERPLGELIKNRATFNTQLSIINCSRIPFQRKCYTCEKLPPKLIEFFSIKSICDASIQAQKYNIKRILNTEIGLESLHSFESRLYASKQISKKAKIVVFGVIAQCYFEEVTKRRGSLRNTTYIPWKEFNLSVFYEYHPSSKSWQWCDYSGMQALRDYVS